MKVTVLMENTSPGSLIHEHGLSRHLSYRGHSVLLDAGSLNMGAVTILIGNVISLFVYLLYELHHRWKRRSA